MEFLTGKTDLPMVGGKESETPTARKTAGDEGGVRGF